MSDQDKDLEQEIIEKEQTDDAPDTNKDEKDGYEDICYLPPAGEQSGQNDKNPKQYLYLSGLYAKDL